MRHRRKDPTSTEIAERILDVQLKWTSKNFADRARAHNNPPVDILAMVFDIPRGNAWESMGAGKWRRSNRANN